VGGEGKQSVVLAWVKHLFRSQLGHPYVSRVASRLGSRDRADLAMLMLMTLPGSVNVYYGDELGMLDTDAPDVKPVSALL